MLDSLRRSVAVLGLVAALALTAGCGIIPRSGPSPAELRAKELEAELERTRNALTPQQKASLAAAKTADHSQCVPKKSYEDLLTAMRSSPTGMDITVLVPPGDRNLTEFYRHMANAGKDCSNAGGAGQAFTELVEELVKQGGTKQVLMAFTVRSPDPPAPPAPTK